MIFKNVYNIVDEKRWKYYGECTIDRKKKFFMTNHKLQFDKIKKEWNRWGAINVKGKINKNYRFYEKMLRE